MRLKLWRALLRQYLQPFLPASMRADGVVIPVVRLSGAIMPAGSALRQTMSLASTAGMLEKAFSFKKAPAVAIAINSPGGSPVQSRLIFRRIRDLAEEKNKKVYVFVEDLAASGGYMIAVAGDEIIADPSSIVGSIGVERRLYTAGKNKALLDPFSPEKKEDVARLKALQLDIHETFIDLVKVRRGAKLADSDDLFSGMFWSGRQGLELGLVDQLGDMRSFLKARYGEKTRLRLVSAPRGLFGRRLNLFGVGQGGGDSEKIAGALASGVVDALEERALWSRFGL